MQTVIKEMLKRVADAEKRATPSESPSEHQKRIAQVGGGEGAAGEFLTHMEAEAQALEHMQAELKSQNANLKVKKQEADAIEMDDVPRRSTSLALRAPYSRSRGSTRPRTGSWVGERAMREGPAGDRLRCRG